jgi:hypothetical protein
MFASRIEIGVSADRYCALVSVAIYLNAFNGTPGNKIEQRVRGFLTAAIQFALLIAAKLI